MSAVIPTDVRRRLFIGLYVTVGVVLVVLFLAPLAWAAYSSFFGPQANRGQGGLGLRNYEQVITYGIGLGRYVLNSVIVAALTVGGTLLLSVPAGYAFARYRFPGRNIVFFLVLAILMIPHAAILIPIYTMLSKIGLQSSLVSVALVLVVFQLPFSVFMMRGAFEAVPKELEEAALLDGCSPFGALRRVMLPVVVPGLVTVAMFAFLASWNEFLTPLLLLTNGGDFTLPVALVTMRLGEVGAIDFGALQAGVITAAIPCLLIFVFLQKYYVQGFTAGAVRG